MKKAIVILQNSPRDPRRALGHCYKLHSPAGDEVPSLDRVVKIITNIEGIVSRQAALDVQSLSWDHHGKGKLLRPVILSMQDCFTADDRDTAFQKLELMAQEYAAAFAAGAAYIGIIHRDRWHPHLHLFFCNSIAGRTIDWQPSTVRRMQSMDWTSHAAPGRGQGHNRAVSVYPLAQNLDVKKLATFSPTQINELIAAGTLTVGRCNKRGEITSVILAGRRIRLATVQRFAAPAAAGAAPRLVFNSEPGLELAASRPAPRRRSLRGRRRTTARARKRQMAARSASKISAQPAHDAPAKAPGVAPGFRLALSGLEPTRPAQPRVGQVERDQNLDRRNGGGASR